MRMQSQDIFLLLKLVSLEQQEKQSVINKENILTHYTLRALSEKTGISKSQISLALQRCYDVTLAKSDRYSGVPRANIKALEEFIVYGIRYIFPVKLQEVTRGIPTGLAAPILKEKLMTTGELIPVWKYARGKKGQAVEPLFKTVPQAALSDERLYAFLALTDAIRLGQARERAFATDKLSKMLRGIE